MARGIRIVVAGLVLGLLFGLTSYSFAQVLDEGLIGYWKFDEGAGAIAKDSLGNNNVGEIIGAKWTAGKFGNALEFDGKHSRVNIEQSESLSLRGDDSFTISAWINPESFTSTDRGPIIFSSYGGNWKGFILQLMGKSGEPRLYVHKPQTLNMVKGHDALKTGQWYHIAGTYSSGKAMLYVNGVLKGSADGRIKYNDFGSFTIGKASWAEVAFFTGKIDEVRLYNRALDKEKIKAVYTEKVISTAKLIEKEPAEKKHVRVEIFVPEGKASIVLAKGGKPGATIVVKKDVTPLQGIPAEELQKYIYKITGALLPIVDDSKIPKGNLILVGESKLTRKMGIRIDKFSGDSFIIKTAPGQLVLAGHDAQMGIGRTEMVKGTANAVNVFLQDYCGVRWFMPGELGEVVPKRKILQISEISRREGLFRLYACGRFIGSEWGNHNFFGTSVFLYHPGGHIWRRIVPAHKYFDKHPEWFALVNGKRIKGDPSHVYLCTSNREMWKEAAKNLKKMCARGYEMIEIGQADGYKRCRCEKCEAMDEYRAGGGGVKGKPADRIWVFHDYLAREVHKTYPDVKIIICCYGPTYEVPKRIKELPDYVTVEWCHPDPESLERWKKFHDKFAFYQYWFTGEMRDYFPVSLFYVASEFERLTYAGARGYFFCGGGDCWGTNAPTYYLLGQLLRNPKLDEYTKSLKKPQPSREKMLSQYGQELRYPEKYVDEILDEFCEGLFGKADKPMKAFFKTFHMASARKTKIRLEAKGKVPLKDTYTGCFTDEVIDSCDRSLKEAQRLANDDIVQRRIRFFKDGFDYAKLTTYGFARLKEYEEDSSDKNLSALKESVIRRNKFVKEMHERQKSNYGKLPRVMKGSLEDLLYGARPEGRKRQFVMPFKMDFENM